MTLSHEGHEGRGSHDSIPILLYLYEIYTSPNPLPSRASRERVPEEPGQVRGLDEVAYKFPTFQVRKSFFIGRVLGFMCEKPDLKRFTSQAFVGRTTANRLSSVAQPPAERRLQVA